MSKPLNDKQRKAIWGDIERALIDASNPREGEVTLDEIMEATGLSRSQSVKKMGQLVSEGIVEKRQIAIDGNRCNVYFALRDASFEEILNVLTK
ncbi:MAG: hypothetical protein ACXADW_22500 [Candidatus Hodarchaeales archaeon]|jgi:DNA-binding transcriptional regulator GbsR (MarR family)